VNDKAWQKKLDKAVAKYLGGNVIAVDRVVVGNKKGFVLTAKDPDRIKLEPIDGWPVVVRPLRGVLTGRDLVNRMAAHEWVDWHPMYEREHWRDKDGPVKIVDVWMMPSEREETWMVMYKCQDPHCLGCRHPTSPAGKFHHKLIRPDGMDSIGRCEEIQMGRRKSENILVDQPVFTDAEFRVPQWMDPDHPDPEAAADAGMGMGSPMDDGQH
jgi:hypothetical protein